MVFAWLVTAISAGSCAGQCLTIKSVNAASTYFRKNKSVGIDIPSYSKFFVLNQNSLNSETEFEVGEGAKKSEIRAAFKKSLTKSKFNRKILSEFVGLIA